MPLAGLCQKSGARRFQDGGAATQHCPKAALAPGERLFPVAEHVEVESVRVPEVAGLGSDVGDAVLPDDLLGLAVDDDDAVTQVVHDDDVAGWQLRARARDGRVSVRRSCRRIARSLCGGGVENHHAPRLPEVGHDHALRPPSGKRRTDTAYSAPVLQTTVPSRLMRVIQASRISVMRISPFEYGVTPFG